MKNRYKITIALSVIITIIAVIYQRSTGPTYPKRVDIVLGEESVRVKLPRSQGGTVDARIEIPQLANGMTGKFEYRRFPTNDPWTELDLKVEDKTLVGLLPNQPPAGKLQYHITLYNNGTEVQKISSRQDPIYIRYKGEVPTAVLAPHIFFMFLAMLFSTLCGLEALFKTQSVRKLSYITTGSLLIGGMVLGPIVQKYAFGVYWAGFPYDWDLTDNKLLISVVFWVGASLANAKVYRPKAAILAAIVLIGMYSIPHSMMGSQYNYDKGEVETDK